MAVSTQNCFPYRFGFSSQRRLINAAPQSYSVIEKTFFFFKNDCRHRRSHQNPVTLTQDTGIEENKPVATSVIMDEYGLCSEPTAVLHP